MATNQPSLSDIIRITLTQSLERRAVQKCSRWAEKYRIMGEPFPGPWSFKYHPWTIGMSDSESEMNCSMKGAQLSVTEMLLNRVFFSMDVLRLDCLYVLPNVRPDTVDFSASRFDAALKRSPHLRSMFSEVKNVGHKMAGAVNLYLRGSRSESGLKSIPAGQVFLDEFDEMDPDAMDLAKERMSGQRTKRIWAISTPTIPGFGIDKLFMDSTQERFTFKCPHCSRMIDLTVANLVVCGESHTDPRVEESHLICGECKHVLDHRQKPYYLADGVWVPTYPQRRERGFHISQFYSSTVSPVEIAVATHKSKTSRAAEQQLWNSKYGLPIVTSGSKVTIKQIEDAIARSTHSKMVGPTKDLITMGIDVGRVFHVVITAWKFPSFVINNNLNANAYAYVLYEATVPDPADIVRLVEKYRPHHIVGDSMPERRLMVDFCKKWPSTFSMCQFSNGRSQDVIRVGSNESIRMLTADRTYWLDISLGRFIANSINLPTDVSTEYKDQVQVPTRVQRQDQYGNPIAQYLSAKDDHFAFAQMYSEIALAMTAGVGKVENIKDAP
jgi:hypothetical protein